jgi:DNA-binding XRE family transcriptional regulator
MTSTAFSSTSLPRLQHTTSRSFSAPRVHVGRVSTIPAAVPSQSLSCDIGSRFGLRLREFRQFRNITQTRMAIDFGIDRSFISDVERGRKSISLRMLEVIALGMEVSLSDLLAGI